MIRSYIVTFRVKPCQETATSLRTPISMRAAATVRTKRVIIYRNGPSVLCKQVFLGEECVFCDAVRLINTVI